MSEKKEYIERGALKEKAEIIRKKMLTERHEPLTIDIMNDFADLLDRYAKNIPAADVEPVVRGEWKDRCVRDWVCSLCGCEIQKVRFYDGYRYTSLPDFCPDCGAVMTEAGLKKIAERSGSGE